MPVIIPKKTIVIIAVIIAVIGAVIIFITIPTVAPKIMSVIIFKIKTITADKLVPIIAINKNIKINKKNYK